MVRKLYKHEFIALGRLLLPLYCICLAVSLVFGLSMRFLDSSESSIVSDIVTSVSGFGFFISIFGVFIATYILLLVRFYNNFAKSEGYLTLSLPVSIDAHITCKLVCGILFIIFSVIAIVMSIVTVLIFTGIFNETVSEFVKDIKIILSTVSTRAAVTSVIQAVILVLLSAVQSLIMPYAAISMGQRSRSKLAMSVVWYFVFNAIMQTVSTIAAVVLSIVMCASEASAMEEMLESLETQTSAALWMSIALVLVASVVYFIITKHNLKNRLNLE